jgi:D-lactate dehydrogenase
MPHPAPAQMPVTRRDGAAAVYVPACINRIFGRPRGAGDGLTVVEAMVVLSERAGLPLWIPDDVAGNCCGTPWSSKGFARGHELMSERSGAAIRRWTGDGELPVVTDASSCAHGFRGDGVEMLDSVDWLHDHVLPRLDVRRAGTVAVHPTCSVRHMGTVRKLDAIVGALADEVVRPATPTCCGFAGDRGFLHPELPATAITPEGAGLNGHPLDAAVSTNRTCEIGLHQATGRPYTSVAQLMEEVTRG